MRKSNPSLPLFQAGGPGDRRVQTIDHSLSPPAKLADLQQEAPGLCTHHENRKVNLQFQQEPSRRER